MPLPAVRCRPEQAGDKTVRTDCVCSGAHCAAVGGFAALRMRRALAGSDRLAGWQYLRYVFYGVRPPSLSFRGAKRCGNLAGPGWITGKFRQNRDCLPEIATAPSGPRNDKSGGLAPLNLCRNHCQPAWRSLSAAADAIGAYHFNDSLFLAQVQRRAWLSPPLQRAHVSKTRRAGWAARRAAGLTSGARGRGPGGSSRSGSP